MTTNDIDAIRHRWRELQNAPQPGLVTSRLIIAEQSAADVPALCNEIEQLRAEVKAVLGWRDSDLAELAKVRDQLTAANHRADGAANDLRSATKANTAYANENARLRSKLADLEDVGRCDHDAPLDVECRPCLVETYGQRETEAAR